MSLALAACFLVTSKSLSAVAGELLAEGRDFSFL